MAAKAAPFAASALVLVTQFGCAQQGHSQAPVMASPSPSGSAAPQTEQPDERAVLDASNPDLFTLDVLKLFQSADPGGTWSRKEALTLTNRNGLIVSLDRILGVCRNRPDACQREVTHFVTAARDVAARGSVKAQASQFVALVRDRSYLAALPPEAKAKLISDPLVADLVVVYAVDLGASVRGAQEQDLLDTGVTRQALARTARENVDTRVQSPTADIKCEGPGVQAVARGNYLESSRLLLDNPWAALAASNGPIVAAAPGADVLLFACNPDSAVLAKLAQAAEHFWRTADRPISPTLLKWSSAGWSELRR